MDYFWVNASGNTSDAANHWATVSGGAPNAANVPGSGDNVYFDSLSSATAYTVTVNAVLTCNTFRVVAAPLTSGVVTITPTNPIDVYGDFTLTAGAQIFGYVYGGLLRMRATSGTKGITTAGTNMQGTYLLLNGPGGTFQLADNYLTRGGFVLTAGTFDPNGKTVTMQRDSATISGPWSFYNLAINTTNNFGTTVLRNDITVTNLFSTAGFGPARRWIGSDIQGVQRTITAANVSLSDCLFSDIVGAGAANWSGTRIGDIGGNSGITFTPAANKYYVGHTAQVDSPNMWATTSGGAGATNNYPLPQDTLVFDANSFNADGQTATWANQYPPFGNVDLSAVNRPVNLTGNMPNLLGDLKFSPYVTYSYVTPSRNVRRSGVQTITSNGGVLGISIGPRKPLAYVYLYDIPPIGATDATTVRFADAFALDSVSTLYLGTGTIEDQGFSVTVGKFDANNADTRSLNATGVWTLTGVGAVWDLTSTAGLTLVSVPSKVNLTNASVSTKTFVGGGKTYNNVEFAGNGSGPFIISGSNTFNQLKDSNPNAPLQITAGTTQTIADPQINGADASHLMTVQSTSTGTYTLTKSGGGIVNAHDISISRCTAGPASTWYAANSTNGGNNTGIIFGARLNAVVASFSASGIPARLAVTRRINAAVATFAAEGIPARLAVNRRLSADVANFALDGIPARLASNKRINAATSNFALNGIPAQIRLMRWIADERYTARLSKRRNFTASLGKRRNLTATMSRRNLTARHS